MDEEITSEILQDEDADVFREALAYLQQKAVVSYTDFKRLREWYRPLAFSVSGYTSLEVLNTFLEALQEAVESGTTKRDFREQKREAELWKQGSASDILDFSGFLTENLKKTGTIS